MIKIVAFEDDKQFIAALKDELNMRNIEHELMVYSSVHGAQQASGLRSADVLLLDYYGPDGAFHAAVPSDFNKPIIAISTASSKNQHAVAKFSDVHVESKLAGSHDAAAMRIVDKIIEVTKQ